MNSNTKINTKLFEGASPSQVIAEASDEHGNTVRMIVETVLLVTSYDVSAPQLQAQALGDALDLELATKAEREGIGKVLLSIPTHQPSLPCFDDGCTKVRVYTRNVPNTLQTNVVGYKATSAVKFIN